MQRGSSVNPSFTNWDILGVVASTAKDVMQSAADAIQGISFARPDENREIPRGHRRTNSFTTLLGRTIFESPRSMGSEPGSNTSSPRQAAMIPMFENIGTTKDAISVPTGTLRRKGSLHNVMTSRIGESLPLALGIDTEESEVEYAKSMHLGATVSVLAPSTSNIFEEEQWIRAPVFFVIVLDWSVIDDEGLSSLANVLSVVVRDLKPEDRFCLVTSECGPVYSMTAENCQKVINSLMALSGAFPPKQLLDTLMPVLELIESNHHRSVGVTSILLISHSEMKNDLADSTCVEHMSTLSGSACLSTFGYGSNHDHEFLGRLARAGRGLFHHIPDCTAVSWCIGDAVGSAMSTLGFNVHLMLTATVGNGPFEVHTHFPVSHSNGTTDIAIGHVSLEESRAVLLDVAILSLEAPQDMDSQIEIVLEYSDIKSHTIFRVQDVIRIARPAVRTSSIMTFYRGVAIERERIRFQATECFSAIQSLSANGDVGKAATALGRLRSALQKSRAKFDPMVLTILVDVDLCAKAIESRDVFEQWGQRAILSVHERHAMQRPAGCTGDAFGCPWREHVGFEQLYVRCPTTMSTFRVVAQSAREQLIANRSSSFAEE